MIFENLWIPAFARMTSLDYWIPAGVYPDFSRGRNDEGGFWIPVLTGMTLLLDNACVSVTQPLYLCDALERLPTVHYKMR
jgi:hypothetical protein